MTKVADLSTQEAAKLAREIWCCDGMQNGALKLIYHVLTEDENNSSALQTLVEMVDSLAIDSMAVALTEYVLKRR